MRIGIKYCGGCNPYYNRSRAAAKIKETMQGHVLKPYESGEKWDAVIVICGCAAACAVVDAGEKTIYINSEQDIGKALAALNE